MKNEFIYAEKSDFEDIITLWIDAFGDDREYIQDFFNKYYNDKRILVSKQYGKVIAMASVFDIDYKNRKAVYVFALAVDKNYRNRNIASELLLFIQSSLNCDIVLQPEFNGVENFYKKIGFRVLDAFELDVIVKKYNLEELTLGYYDGFIRKKNDFYA